MSTLDKDKNSQVDWNEFASLMAERWLRQDGEVDLSMAFSMLAGMNPDEDEPLDVPRSTLPSPPRCRLRPAPRRRTRAGLPE